MAAMICATDRWKAEYPGAVMGALVMRGVAQATMSPRMQAMRREVEQRLRADCEGLTREQLKALPGVRPYVEYYKRFGKSYHVLLQMESILKGGAVQRETPLVEAMFLAEVRSQLLTAGHDLAAVERPVTVDCATGAESYVTLGGAARTVKAGDMFVRDEAGILSTILYGPDDRTRLRESTDEVLFVVYGPPGILPAQMQAHLDDLAEYVKASAPSVQIEAREIVQAA